MMNCTFFISTLKSERFIPFLTRIGCVLAGSDTKPVAADGFLIQIRGFINHMASDFGRNKVNW
jgi:hypothetical protein